MKILLIKRGAIGDILMTTPLVRQLRQNLPNAVIDYCVAFSFKVVLENNKYLDNIIALDDKMFNLNGLFGFMQFAFSVRKKYDYIFILGKSWQINLLGKIFSGIKIGYAREAISKFLLDKYVIYNNILRYHGLYYLDVLKISGLGCPNYSDIELDLLITEKDRTAVLDKCNAYNLQGFVIVVNSGGNNQYESGGIRMLPKDKILELLNALLRHHQVILLGGYVDRSNYTDYFEKLNCPTNLFNWAGELSLAQSTYLISLAKHVYTTDCGAMHLGVVAQLGNKMTCFFGPTHPQHVLPENKGFRIYWSDQDIFDKSYPLLGTELTQKYFKNLNINDAIVNICSAKVKG